MVNYDPRVVPADKKFAQSTTPDLLSLGITLIIGPYTYTKFIISRALHCPISFRTDLIRRRMPCPTLTKFDAKCFALTLVLREVISGELGKLEDFYIILKQKT